MYNKEDFNWYMISTISGKEEKVIESLGNRIKSEQLENYFDEVKMFEKPHLTQKELDKKINGESFVVKKENIYKGYIFIKMLMTDAAWFMVRNTQYVTGLIGSSGKGAKPTPVSNRQIKKMFELEKKLWDEFEQGNIESHFKVGLMVKVNNGPFIGQIGVILDNDDKNNVAWVEMEIFGKKTPTEFSHRDLELVE